MVEVLEKAFKLYQQKEQAVNEINVYQQAIKSIENKCRLSKEK
jgi:hypothetical protein